MIPILMYHIVDDENFSKISIPTKLFAEHVAFLKSEGYRSLTIAEYVTAIRNPKQLPEDRSVLITFDDGYVDVLTQAAPVLSAAGYSACVFLISNYAGDLNLWNRKACYLKRHLSWAEILELLRVGFDIGAHTQDHHCLVKFDANFVEKELKLSQIRIQQETGRLVRAFAYPYGDVNPMVATLAAKFYDVAFSVDQGSNDVHSSPFAINRLSVDKNWDIKYLASQLLKTS